MTADPIVWPALGLLLAALAMLGVWRWVRRRRSVARAWGDAALLRRTLGADLNAVPAARVALVALAATSLAAALLLPRPPDGAGVERGGPVVLVLDASGSMLARDTPPSRLALQRDASRALIEAVPGLPVGIVAFAGRAYALAPPTTDVSSLSLYLDALDPSMVTQTGSSLAAAVRQAVALLAAGEREGGTVVLISDGDSAEDPTDLEAIAAVAERAGIRVHVAGAGTPAGAPVPAIDLTTGEQLGLMREPDGSVAVSRRNDALLREIATRTGGSYLTLSGRSTGRLLASRILSAGAGPAPGAPDGTAPYVWPAGLALLLLAVERLVARRAERAP